jgi:hypothetical protein
LAGDALDPRSVEVEQRARAIAAAAIRRERSEAYDAEVARWKSMRSPGGLGFGAGASSKPALRILAEGDSWFDFPFGGKPFRGGDVIERLRDLVPFPILNLAVRGDEARFMLGCTQRRRLRELLADPSRDFNVLLFSGGGNDLVGEAFRLWIRDRDACDGDPARAVNDASIGCILQVVRTAYEDLLDLRDRIAAATPGRTISVLLHAYDWAVPTGAGVCGYGPWLKPSLEDRGWTNPAEARAIVKDALTRFANLLADIARQYDDVTVVGTQGTLGRTDWNDELHPNREGFQKVARCFHTAMKQRFPEAVR